MKINKLPNTKCEKTTLSKTYSLLALFLIVTVMSLAFFAKELPMNTTIVSPAPVVEKTKADVILDTATDIIMRDGKVPENVARKYTMWIFEASHKHNVDPITILSVMSVESSFKQDAVSGANAIGLLQIIHFWHKEKTTQVALFDPKNNIDVGVRILREYTKRSKSETEMLLRYNGTLGKSNKYANKVFSKRDKYRKEIILALNA